MQTAAYVVRDWNYLIRRSVGLALSTTNQRLDITRTVSQFLFEGFEDPLITIASRVPGLSGLEIPDFDKFGWFYMVSQALWTEAGGRRPSDPVTDRHHISTRGVSRSDSLSS